MAITFPLALPTTFGASSFIIDLIPVIAVSSSPFTKQEQVQEHQGISWEIQYQANLLNRDQAEEYNAFILSLTGRLGTFTMAIPGSETPRGVATGTPLVDGAAQTGEDLDIKGFSINTTGIMKAGDYIQLGTGLTTTLHKVLVDADSDGTGLTTLTIAPKILTAPADSATVVVSNAKGLFRLTSNTNPVTISPPNQHSISFTAREVR